ncbi:MAG: glycosyl hydrolase family 28-related protein, partial [Bacteroidales bacterium]|nr:glycosyl hydrolase family 28-related protein [Bacteroidales bacterium]
MKNLFFTLCCLIFAACGNTNNSRVFNVLDYGAVGDSITDDAVAIQKAIDDCNAKGGGQVLFPTGFTFMSGPVELKSNIDIHLEVGATWLANPDESIYNLSAFGENRGEGMMWIYAKDIHDLSISGKGTIDGNGVAFMGKELEDSYELKPLKDSSFDPRPHVLSLFGVNRLSIKDVTIQNGAYWTVHLIGCYDALIDGISLKNKL